MKPLQTLRGVISRRPRVQPDADVAVVGGGIAARVHAPADFDDVGTELGFGRRAHRLWPVVLAALLGAEVPGIRTGAGRQRRGRQRRTSRRQGRERGRRSGPSHPAADSPSRRTSPSPRSTTAGKGCSRGSRTAAAGPWSQFDEPPGLAAAPPPPGGGVRGSNAFEALLGARGFLAVRRHVDDALPCLGGAFEILFAPRANDADVQQRFRMRRIERQRAVELFQRPVGLIGVVVGDPEIGAGVHVLRIDLERGQIPARRFVEALTVEVQIAELGPYLGVARLTLGLRFQMRRRGFRPAQVGRPAAGRPSASWPAHSGRTAQDWPAASAPAESR